MTAPLPGGHAAIAAQWDRHGDHPLFDPARLQHGRLVFSGLQRFYASCFTRLGTGLPNALDLGCGSGDNLVHLLRAGVIRRGTGVEISEGAIANGERLRAHFRIPADALRFVRCPVEDVRLDERFSLIIATQLTGYLPDPSLVFRTAAALAAPGAFLFVSDRQRLSLTPLQALKNSALLRRAFGKPALQDLAGDLHLHPLATITRAATAAGFELIWTRYALHPLAGLLHGAAHALNARRYATRAGRAAAAGAFGLLTWSRRAEDALLARVPTGYLYAALFRCTRP